MACFPILFVNETGTEVSPGLFKRLAPYVFYSSCNAKSVKLQAWSGPEGSRKLKFPDFTKMSQDGGKVVSLTHRPPLPQGNITGTHFC